MDDRFALKQMVRGTTRNGEQAKAAVFVILPEEATPFRGRFL